jgi:hypothetical protein
MSAQLPVEVDDLSETEMLDPDTSAAILRWMETGEVPEGIEPDRWERWADGGSRNMLEANGAPITAAMLGRWARTGLLW